MEDLPGFVLAAIALAGSPGPATLSLAATGAAFGARRSLGYMAGIVGGMVAVIAVTASGVTAAVLAIPYATPVLVGAAGLYFAWLAWRIGTAPPLSQEGGAGRRPTVAGGLFLSMVNPKGYAAMAALFSGFVLVPGRIGADVAAKAALLMLVIAASSAGWLFLGAALTRRFRDPRASRIINVTFAVLLLASFGVALVV